LVELINKEICTGVDKALKNSNIVYSKEKNEENKSIEIDMSKSQKLESKNSRQVRTLKFLQISYELKKLFIFK